MTRGRLLITFVLAIGAACVAAGGCSGVDGGAIHGSSTDDPDARPDDPFVRPGTDADVLVDAAADGPRVDASDARDDEAPYCGERPGAGQELPPQSREPQPCFSAGQACGRDICPLGGFAFYCATTADGSNALRDCRVRSRVLIGTEFYDNWCCPRRCLRTSDPDPGACEGGEVKYACPGPAVTPDEAPPMTRCKDKGLGVDHPGTRYWCCPE